MILISISVVKTINYLSDSFANDSYLLHMKKFLYFGLSLEVISYLISCLIPENRDHNKFETLESKTIILLYNMSN